MNSFNILMSAQHDVRHAHEPGGMANQMRLLPEPDDKVGIDFPLGAFHEQFDVDHWVISIKIRQYSGKPAHCHELACQQSYPLNSLGREQGLRLVFDCAKGNLHRR